MKIANLISTIKEYQKVGYDFTDEELSSFEKTGDFHDKYGRLMGYLDSFSKIRNYYSLESEVFKQGACSKNEEDADKRFEIASRITLYCLREMINNSKGIKAKFYENFWKNALNNRPNVDLYPSKVL